MVELRVCVRVCFDASAHADSSADAFAATIAFVLFMLLLVFYGGAFINRGFPSKVRNFCDSSSNGFV